MTRNTAMPATQIASPDTVIPPVLNGQPPTHINDVLLKTVSIAKHLDSNGHKVRTDMHEEPDSRVVSDAQLRNLRTLAQAENEAGYRLVSAACRRYFAAQYFEALTQARHPSDGDVVSDQMNKEGRSDEGVRGRRILKLQMPLGEKDEAKEPPKKALAADKEWAQQYLSENMAKLNQNSASIIRKLQDDKDALQEKHASEISELQDEKAKLQESHASKIAELQDEKDKLQESHASEISELQDEKAKLQKKISKMQTTLATCLQSASTLLETNAAQGKAHAAQKKKLADFSDGLNILERQFDREMPVGYGSDAPEYPDDDEPEYSDLSDDESADEDESSSSDETWDAIGNLEEQFEALKARVDTLEAR